MKIKSKERIFDSALTLSLIVMFAAIVLKRNISNLDEIWNFNFARNIANGLIPYTNFNMLQTPLLSFILRRTIKSFWARIICNKIGFNSIRSWNYIYII